ncbi:hypothetical protein GCM10009415_37980 [Chitinophaga japonensis]
MKTAKIMLTEIGIFTIMAGILAFKVHRDHVRGVVAYCRSTALGTGVCTTTHLNHSCVPTPNGTCYCTTILGDPCTIAATLILRQ